MNKFDLRSFPKQHFFWTLVLTFFWPFTNWTCLRLPKRRYVNISAKVDKGEDLIPKRNFQSKKVPPSFHQNSRTNIKIQEHCWRNESCLKAHCMDIKTTRLTKNGVFSQPCWLNIHSMSLYARLISSTVLLDFDACSWILVKSWGDLLWLKTRFLVRQGHPSFFDWSKKV